MAQESSAAKKMTLTEQLKPIREKLAGSEEKPALELVPKLEGPKTAQEAEALMAEEGLTQGEKTKITQVSEIATGSPEATQDVAKSEEVAVEKSTGAKKRRNKGIKAVIQKEGEATEVEKEAKEVIDPVAETSKLPEWPKDPIEARRRELEGKIKILEVKPDKDEMEVRMLKKFNQNLQDFNATNEPAEVPVEVTPLAGKEPSLPEIPKTESTPAAKVQAEATKSTEQPKVTVSEKPKDKEHEDYLLKMVDLVKDNDEKALVQKYLDEKNIRIRLTALMDYIKDNVNGRPSDPKSWSEENRTYFDKAMQKIVEEIKAKESFGGMHVDPRLARSLRVAERSVAPEPEKIEKPPKSGEREAAAAEKKLSPEEIKDRVAELVKKPEVVAEVKETPPVEPVVEKSKVVETEPEKTEAKASAMAEDESIPEYRPSLLYAKKKDQLESRLAGIKNLPVNEWSETYGEPGGFDQVLWEQLKEGKDKNEKKRFQELEYNQMDYAIKELETHERLKAIRYGLGERAKILEDKHPTDERRKELERQVTELQQAEKAAHLEIRGIEDLRNKDKAEEKGLFIMARERAAEAAAAPMAPGQFEEEENLVAGLFEINDKIKQVEKVLQAQRELMPRSVLARGMGLEGNEEALKNAEKIMKHHKVIRALEDQLSELEDQKDILLGKQTETGQETNQETNIEENALIKEWKKLDSIKDQGDEAESKAGRIAKKAAIGAGVGVSLGAVGALGAFVKLQYWARWRAPLAVLEFLMKVSGDPGGVLTKSISSVEKSATKFLDKKSKKETNKE